MKHATSEALDRIEPVLTQLRAISELREKTRGVFYRGGRAFLHFHEDGEQLWADIRISKTFERFEATSYSHQTRLLKILKASLRP